MKFLMVIVVLISLVGCVGSPVYESDNQTMPELSKEKARIVFFRYSAHGAVVNMELYRMKGQEAQLIGGLLSSSKIFIDVDPGSYVFMSNGSQRLNFLNAEVDSGKTYYVIAAPYGWPGVSFSLNPVGENSNPEFNLDDKKLKSILKRMTLVSPNLDDYNWGKKTLVRVNKRLDADRQVWEALPDDEKVKFSIVPSYGR